MIPGPIATPTLTSIDAALHPDTADKFIYFLAIPDGDGKHAFAKTNKEHHDKPAQVRLHPVTAARPALADPRPTSASRPVRPRLAGWQEADRAARPAGWPACGPGSRARAIDAYSACGASTCAT